MFHMDILCTTLKEINIKRFVQSAELSFEKVIFDRKAVIFPIFAMQLYFNFLFYICHLNNIIHYWESLCYTINIMLCYSFLQFVT